MQGLWTAFDDYTENLFIPADPILADVLAANAAAGLPAHDVSPAQGKMLQLFAQMIGAQRILEIGTLGAYSTIWFARALPDDGKIITLEFDAHHAKIAQQNLERTGVAAKVEIRQGKAADTLAAMIADRQPSFDLIFIDADKVNNPVYFELSMKLTHPGSVIVFDNVIRKGEVLNENTDDLSAQGIRRMNELLAADPRISVTTIQTVGSKGYDGFTLARVN